MREQLPEWVGWLGIAVYLGVITVCVLFVPIATVASVTRRLDASMHWTERAALFYEGKMSLAVSTILWPILAFSLAPLFMGSYLAIPRNVVTVIALAGIIVVSGGCAVRLSQRFGQPGSPSVFGQLVHALRVWWPFGALVALGFLAPSQLLNIWMIPWVVVAVGALWATRYLPELYVMTGVARPGDEQLQEVVAPASAKFGVDPPRTFVVDSYRNNAAALPSRNIVITTTRFVDELNPDEMEAIMTHEIAHLHEKRSVTLRRGLSNLVFLPFLAVKPLLGTGLTYLVAAMLISLLFTRLLARMARSEESRADEEALERSHQAPMFGRTLLKLYRGSLIPAVIKRDPHGPLHDRLTRAGVEPDFPTDAPAPAKRNVVVGMALSLTVVLAAFAIPYFTIDVYDGGRGSEIALAVGWNTPGVLGYTGYLHAADGDMNAAVVYLEEAARLGDEFAMVDLVWVYVSTDRCDEAEDLMREILQADLDPIDVDLARNSLELCSIDP